MYESRLDLTDTKLKGSIQAYDPIESWYSVILLNKDQDKLNYHALRKCSEEPECAPHLEDDAYIINTKHQQIYAKYTG